MQARATILALILIMLGCADDAETPAATGSTPATPGSTPATRDLSFANLEKHIEILASDEFEGRQPGSVGEEKTVAYIKEQFVKLGLKPGNGDSYFQTVPLGVLTADASVLMSIKRDGYSRDLKYSSEMMLWTKREDTGRAYIFCLVCCVQWSWDVGKWECGQHNQFNTHLH